VITVEINIELKLFNGKINKMMIKNKIWTPFKIWNGTHWFDDNNEIIKKFRNKNIM
jgi:hypothetical protein